MTHPYPDAPPAPARTSLAATLDAQLTWTARTLATVAADFATVAATDRTDDPATVLPRLAALVDVARVAVAAVLPHGSTLPHDVGRELTVRALSPTVATAGWDAPGLALALRRVAACLRTDVALLDAG